MKNNGGFLFHLFLFFSLSLCLFLVAPRFGHGVDSYAEFSYPEKRVFPAGSAWGECVRSRVARTRDLELVGWFTGVGFLSYPFPLLFTTQFFHVLGLTAKVTYIPTCQHIQID